VPDDPEQPTSDHGWDFVANRDMLKAIVARLKKTGARISLFCDPDASQEHLRPRRRPVRPDRALHRPLWQPATTIPKRPPRNWKSSENGRDGWALGLEVNAGHDLTVANLPALARAIPDLAEVSIGHGLTADALEHGMAGR
jgi:pyridoxine 5-phosphate synthase